MVRRRKGEGTIYRTKSGYAAQYMYMGKRKTISGKTAAEVRKKLNEALNQIEKGIYIDVTKSKDGYTAKVNGKHVKGSSKQELQQKIDDKVYDDTVGNYCREWLERIKPYVNERGTYKTYCWRIERIIEGLGEDTLISNLKSNDIQDFINWLMLQPKKRGKGTLKPSSIREVYTNLCSILQSASDNDILVKPIIGKRKIKLPSESTQRKETLTIEELETLINTLKKPMEVKTYYDTEFVREILFVSIAIEVNTGLRISELLGLRWQDINHRKHTISIKQQLTNNGISDKLKTKASYREIMIDDTILKLLDRHKKGQAKYKLLAGSKYIDNDLIFAKQDGRALCQRTFYRWYLKALEVAGIYKDIDFHCLRHTFATLGIEEGLISPKTLQAMLGQASAKTFWDIYSHVTPKMQQTAAKTIASRIKI